MLREQKITSVNANLTDDQLTSLLTLSEKQRITQEQQAMLHVYQYFRVTLSQLFC